MLHLYKRRTLFSRQVSQYKVLFDSRLNLIPLILLAEVFKSTPSETAQIGLCRFYGLYKLINMCTLLCFTCLGLLDFSPEEIRLEAYTANAKGSADGYVRINTLYCIIVNSIVTREKKNRSSAAWTVTLELVF